MRLSGKVALVTGSTQGIGKAIAERFAAEGATLAIVASKDLQRAESVAGAIRDNGGRAEAFVADCAKVDEIRKLVAAVTARLGTIDILVNNAGVMHTAAIEDTTEEKWDSQLDLNLKGAFFLTQACLPEFKRKGRGKVINVTSIWGIGAGRIARLIAPRRADFENLTRALAVEIGKYGINVNSWRPANRNAAQRPSPRSRHGRLYRADARLDADGTRFPPAGGADGNRGLPRQRGFRRRSRRDGPGRRRLVGVVRRGGGRQKVAAFSRSVSARRSPRL